MSDRVLLRDEIWRVEESTASGDRTVYRLRSEESGSTITVVSPPDTLQPLLPVVPTLDRRAFVPFASWATRHEILWFTAGQDGWRGTLAGRVQPEPYQLVPAARLFSGPNRSLLVADDVGLGKTVEAGLCILELMARQVATRVLLVVPPGLVDQWVDEMQRRFGLSFRVLANSTDLDVAQTALADGISPWAFHECVVTSTEYLKKPDVTDAALRKPWDVVIVDEAHYLAESGSPASPYSTRRTRLGLALRKAARAMLLLTATPHNGYRHGFRSLLELVEPTHATLEGSDEAVQRRVARSMVRRLKPQITRVAPDGTRTPAFLPRAPVRRLEVGAPSQEEREIFRLVTRYCDRTAAAASDSDARDLVAFAMQVVKKRMLSTRAALVRTIAGRLDALREAAGDTLPSRAELRDMQGDLPLAEPEAERLVDRLLRTSVPSDARRRSSEQRQLREVKRVLDRVADRPDPKLARLLEDLHVQVASQQGEKAIIFTEYRDSLGALRAALDADPAFAGCFVELTGGLTPRQRRERIARFSAPECRLLLATDAASEGLNLQQHCRRLYHLELPWNPNRLEQRNGRVDRYGQTRTPEIAYLFYVDSPEDRVLDRLVARITTMQVDLVATPDIVGVVEAVRLPDRLLSLGEDADPDVAFASLERTFEQELAAFRRDLAPLLAAGEVSAASESEANTAGAVVEDDLAFERTMLALLGAGALCERGPGVYQISVPPVLRGTSVPESYTAATFRRSVAMQDVVGAVEFVHRLHPLARAATEHALRLLRQGGAGTPAANLALRRAPVGLDVPVAVFTLLDRATHPTGALRAVGLTLGGEALDGARVRELVDPVTPPGDVPWEACERTFAPYFAALQERAAALALAEVEGAVEGERRRREGVAGDLRAEVAAYRKDRRREIDREEAAERAGARDQGNLFRETRTDWDARRAAVDTNADQRLERIEAWATLDDPAPPEPLGVLLVVPEGWP